MADPRPAVLDVLREASNRLVRTVDAITEAQWHEPTVLPGWDRAHVVAHVALNAEGLSGAVRGVLEGEPRTMYVSNEARNADIEELAAQPAVTLRERLLASVSLIQSALEAVPDDRQDSTFERTPGAQRITVARVPLMRLREVEIHHSDLGLGYSPTDWAPDSVALLLDFAARRPGLPGMTVEATDLGRTWTIGDGGPTVRGRGGELAWWLSGRAASGLTSDDGVLPRIEEL